MRKLKVSLLRPCLLLYRIYLFYKLNYMQLNVSICETLTIRAGRTNCLSNQICGYKGLKTIPTLSF
jgi:hypothetical protein